MKTLYIYVLEVKMMFCNNFDKTDMGALEHFLNVRVTRIRRFIQLDQSVYTQKVLDKFADFLGPHQKSKKSPLPSDASERIARAGGELSDDDRVYLNSFPYRSLLGALLYLSMNTRPDIAYAVRLLSRSNPNSICENLTLTNPNRKALVLNLLCTHTISWCTCCNMYAELCRAVLDLEYTHV